MDEIDPRIAYQKTLKGIFITFVICNVLILCAVVGGFFYTTSLIKATHDKLDEKIEKTYAAWAEFGKKQAERIDAVTSAVKSSNEAVTEQVKGVAQEVKENRKELEQKLEEKGRDLLKKLVK